jgi:type II secretory ATPase GspE/PulE/Tfp pilus assembly ATPase PilB-like protein
VEVELKPIEEGELNLDKVIAEASEAPVVKFVDLLIKRSINDRASDIHIEPLKDAISVRYRIDGILYEISPPAKHLIAPLVSRVKILAKLDIAEKRLPQDGGFIIKMEDRVIDVRVSTIPTIYGEKVVMRLLDKSTVPLDLGQLGFEAKALDDFRKAIRQPYGLILLTGPTGSGKTTTLYAALNEIKSAAKNVITIEDPVEYRLDGINQVQAKPNIGLTFAAGLRAFLRQDPDIIMVGEVRDLETAQICVRASLTGHLVFSTLHTTDAAGAISRMIDIGIEPYLLVSSLTLVGAQRLVRKLCPDCKEAYEVTPQIQEKVFLKQDLLYKAKGCDKCNQIGYRGRTAIYEILPITEKIKDLIYKRSLPQVLRETARQQGMRTLWESGIKKVEDGITSLEELMSITLGAD